MRPFRSCCEQINEKGQGVGKTQEGKLVFASNWLPGEVAWLRPLQIRSTYIVADIECLENPSPSREKPFCAHFSKCGGCQLQHMTGEAQRQFKESLFVSYHEKLGIQSPALTWVLGPSKAYRTKLILPIEWPDGEEKPRIGFYQTHSQQIEVLHSCAIHTPALEKVIQHASTWLYEWAKEWKNSLEDTKEAPWKAVYFLYARQTDSDSKVHIALGLRAPLAWNAWSERLEALAPQNLDIHGVSAILQSKESNVWLEGEIERKSGPLGMIVDQKRYQLEVDPFAFQQVNPAMAQKVRVQILKWIQEIRPARFLELFCGAGNLANSVAFESGVEVVGVDNLEANIISANHNAEKIGSGAHFICQDALLWAEQNRDKNWSVWMVNPPRKGLGESLTQLILDCGPEFLVYMACGQKAFAKDTQWLQSSYALVEIQAYEMFAQTVHFETLSLWKRR